MTKSALLGAAALLSAMAATPVTAQEVIYNPGYCAQFYPNANCQNKGPNNPYTGDYQRRNEMRGAYARCVCPERRSLRAGCGVLSWPGRPAGTIATDATEGIRGTDHRPQIGSRRSHSLAIPISLITRAYLAS
jgi:hypothetical protein